MARNRKTQPYTKVNPLSVAGWFGSSNESVEGIIDWDCKAQTLAEAILGVLAHGSAIMFGVSMAGDAVSVTIYDGEVKHRKWVTDCVELDDLMAIIWKRGHNQRLAEVVDISQGVAD
jgi:hypothetical protein